MTKIEFIQDFIDTYIKDPSKRAVEYNIRNEAIGCKYYLKVGNKIKNCAIGKHLDEETAILLDKRGAIDSIFLDGEQSNLPKWMENFGEVFLSNIQDLHDSSKYWLNYPDISQIKNELKNICQRNEINFEELTFP